jgi:hypothetical protein
VLALSAFAALPAMAGSPARMSVDDVIALLKAGVGEKVVLAQVRATGARPALTVAEILKLKAAGASDDLLAALVDPVSADSTPQATRSFRVFREVNAMGEEVLHITNLDEAGRRIGGEVEHRDPANVTRTGARQRDESLAEDRPAPVIVNIYPPESPAPQDSYQGPYQNFYPGFRAGYGGRGYWPRAGGNHQPRPDFEPGLFSRPAVIDTRPYRQKTAAERNRARFRNH